MNNVVKVERPNMVRAREILWRMPVAQPAAQPAVCSPIADSVVAAVQTAVGMAVPYSSNGATLSTDFEVEHRAADGSFTVARMKLRYGRGT